MAFRHSPAAAALLIASGLAPAHADDYPCGPSSGWCPTCRRRHGHRGAHAGREHVQVARADLHRLEQPGAAIAIGADYAARAKPSTATWCCPAIPLRWQANPPLYLKLSYDPQNDFAPVGLMARFSLILVVNPRCPSSSRSSRPGPRAQKDGVNYGTPGAAARTTWRPSCSACAPD